MRVADRDRANSAQPADLGDEVVIDVGDHVEEHVAAGGTDQQRALADGSRRVGADADDAGSFLLHPATVTLPVSSARLVHCWPSQPAYWRSSAQMGQSSRGPAYWTPQVLQIGRSACM
jgi:hypothetical protein